jgi:endonuclease/exonuclease/phosphatase family metal-dependent hydrolase
MEFAGAGKLHLGSFYRPPSGGIEPLEKLQDSVNKVLSKTPATNTKHKNIVVCGDFNLPDIDWGTGCVKPESKQKSLHNQALEILGELPLTQLQTKVTRQASQNVLDLIYTNNQNMISDIQTHPGISDHDIVTCNIHVSPKLKRKPPRKIYMYNKADNNSLKDSLQK